MTETYSEMIAELRALMRDRKYDKVHESIIMHDIRVIFRKHGHSDTYYDWLGVLPAMLQESAP